jgi:hypothetical protein
LLKCSILLFHRRREKKWKRVDFVHRNQIMTIAIKIIFAFFSFQMRKLSESKATISKFAKSKNAGQHQHSRERWPTVTFEVRMLNLSIYPVKNSMNAELQENSWHENSQ